MKVVITGLEPTGMPAWRAVQAILDSVEPGASRHCLYRGHTDDGFVVWKHPRLDVAIELRPC